ncbi:hypothetical protein Slala03_14350 [Streptomyces lavendulae subsp. lavendulae]|nr:hypothetical protein Slala03_14350 [Streptomyces lavendulae subsp. lavendulae]
MTAAAVRGAAWSRLPCTPFARSPGHAPDPVALERRAGWISRGEIPAPRGAGRGGYAQSWPWRTSMASSVVAAV